MQRISRTIVSIRSAWRRQRARVAELAIDPIGPTERWYHVGVFTLLVALMWPVLTLWDGDTIQWATIALVTMFIVASDLISAQGAGDDYWITFTDLPLLAYVATFGVDPGFVLILFTATMISHLPILPLMGGFSGLVFNTSMRTIEVIVVGFSFAALHGVIDDPWRVMLLPVIGYLVNLLLMYGTSLSGGFGAEFAVASLKTESIYLTFTIPFAVLIYGTFQWMPLVAIAASAGPVVLTAISTRSQETLMLTERELHLDGLTEVANRRSFDIALAEAIEHGSFSMLIFDVDNFKILNDTHGHMEGDRALIGVAASVRDALRKADFVARYGGEEFAIILTDTPQSMAMDAAERVRAAAEAALSTWKTSISIGVSTWGPDGYPAETPEDCIEQTDSALYVAKRTGKNRCVHVSDAAEGLLGATRAEAKG